MDEENSNRKVIVGAIIAIAVILLVIVLFMSLNGKTYKVTFDTNGGTSISAQEVKEGEKAKKPVNPKKDGYDFVQWLLDDEVFDFETKITRDIELKAEWKEKTEGEEPNDNQEPTDEPTTEPTSEPTAEPTKEKEEQSNNNDSATTISISESKITLKVGETKTLTATVKSDSLEDKSVQWSSGNSSVATVVDGKITAKKAGTATITAKTTDGKKATCKVTVESNSNNSSSNNNQNSGSSNNNQNSSNNNQNSGNNNQNQESKPTQEPTKAPAQETPKEDVYKVSVVATDSDPEALTPQRKVVVTKNGKTISATAVCDSSKTVITNAKSGWKIDKSEASAIAYVLVNGTYYKISK